MTAELVILVDEAGRAIGSAPKATVHHAHTPLHLAFSCYVFDRAGRLLLTQRAHDKPTFPGVWTNSFCGHPSPGEDIFEAVERRAGQELGLTLATLDLVLPSFRYEATGANGVRENELCPVFTATATSAVAPDASEVAASQWITWPLFRDEVLAGERDVSVWCAAQVAELAAREAVDGRLTPCTRAELPEAARPEVQ
ncbi:isopentenyl-diphosphate Delta-isomerase [Nocardioides sp. JQ2195]|uniref:isopentenyl-diphosphate Delta-isomerase n=1 Tax=Nocardioides sp. JQ2195 TaxID=2592334 RepID=UPI00143EEEC9|nr:isopentenyl-diphosphate Delta-isomerase [Nocardioides sp. JQ2195]QIX27176.1 isopentenyl-diphosphate Delta-isomerase [Nocardioides sp. JQ2195]